MVRSAGAIQLIGCFAECFCGPQMASFQIDSGYAADLNLSPVMTGNGNQPKPPINDRPHPKPPPSKPIPPPQKPKGKQI